MSRISFRWAMAVFAGVAAIALTGGIAAAGSPGAVFVRVGTPCQTTSGFALYNAPRPPAPRSATFVTVPTYGYRPVVVSSPTYSSGRSYGWHSSRSYGRRSSSSYGRSFSRSRGHSTSRSYGGSHGRTFSRSGGSGAVITIIIR